ncbi:hypothetical protein BDV97DRAFT_417793 [Delphinella strobiligena]|nr:hypothetical protein BDV97DRAFT_417793 [Delphinella strobiligena]
MERDIKHHNEWISKNLDNNRPPTGRSGKLVHAFHILSVQVDQVLPELKLSSEAAIKEWLTAVGDTFTRVEKLVNCSRNKFTSKTFLGVHGPTETNLGLAAKVDAWVKDGTMSDADRVLSAQTLKMQSQLNRVTRALSRQTMATLTNPKELLKFLMGHMLSDIEAELDVLASQPDSCSTGGRFMDLKGRRPLDRLTDWDPARLNILDPHIYINPDPPKKPP